MSTHQDANGMPSVTRRQFIKSSTVALAATPLAITASAHADGSDTIRIGVIGWRTQVESDVELLHGL